MLDRLVSFRLARISNGLSLSTSRIYSADFGIKLLDWRVIITLKHHPSLTPVEIAGKIDADKGNVSRAITNLVNAGYILREATSEDGRKVHLLLTQRGQALFDQINPIARARERHLLSVLDAQERSYLETILDKLVVQVGKIEEASAGGEPPRQ